MPTVAEILQHPLFQGARVVAGQHGMQRDVVWIHNSGVPDAAYWLNGGELVLTTMLNLPHDVPQRRRYIAELVEKDVAGLVITIGRYIQHTPDYLRAVADAHDFPLIEIPFTARFVDIAKTINEQIAQANLHRVRRALTIHQTLTELVLAEGTLHDLAKTLADLLGHSVSIETDRFEAMATENIAAVDEARRYTQLHGRTDPRLVQALETRGILPEIRRTRRPKYIAAMADVGLEMERILAPIVVHSEIYGYMWFIADAHDLSEIDLMAIESGSTIAALMLLYQERVQNAEASLKGNLFAQLIDGDAERETILTDQSLRYGVDLRGLYAVLLVDCGAPAAARLSLPYRRINRLIADEGWAAVAGQFAGQLVILVQAEPHADVLPMARRIQAEVADTGAYETTPRIGVSAAQQGAGCVQTAYQQCLDGLAIAQRLWPKRCVVRFGELGYLHTLYQAGAALARNNPDVARLRPLLETRHRDFFDTLEAYLDEGGNGVSTAEALHIHRSTLNYRLSRIAQLCAVDLQDAHVRTNLQIAIKLMRLFEIA